MTSPIAHLDAVGLRRPRALVLRNIDLTLEAGDSLALFGANGSGKTTLLRLLATLLRPTSGVGEVLGARLGTSAVDDARVRIGLVGHEPALYPNLTLGENLELAASLFAGPSGKRRARHALEQVGLSAAAHRRASRSSNGMRRRVEFARMLVKRPDLLLLDEAHVGLDPAASVLVEHLVRDVTSRGGAAVIVAHERDRVRRMASAAAEISDGTLVEVSE